MADQEDQTDPMVADNAQDPGAKNSAIRARFKKFKNSKHGRKLKKVRD